MSGESNLKTLIVVRNETIADIWRRSAIGKIATLCGVGANLSGCRFDIILVTVRPTDIESVYDTTKFQNWIDHVIKTKILPTGKIYYT